MKVMRYAGTTVPRVAHAFRDSWSQTVLVDSQNSTMTLLLLWVTAFPEASGISKESNYLTV